MKQQRKSQRKPQSQTSEQIRLCKCGCKGIPKPRNQFVSGHQNRGRKLSEAHKKILIEYNKNKQLSEEHKRKLIEANKGKICSEEHKRKISEANSGRPKLKNRGEYNYRWQGDDISYKALHGWLRKYFLKPMLCQECNSKPSYDLANITGVYNRDFSNWKYLCRKCHWKIDKIIDMSLRTCSICGGSKTRLSKREDNRTSGRPIWHYSKTGGLLCSSCFDRYYDKNIRNLPK